ncbi:MAG: DUF58 domain-containing protein [Desulfuromonadaceae bacterium]|nr:DUF58 domain-containing protein [Desulfuromonadaceae bacterium]
MSVTGIAGMYNIKKVLPSILPPDEIFVGIPAPFCISANNTKKYFPSFLISLECFDGQTIVFPVVQKNSTVQENIMITFKQRGEVPFGKVKISSTYPVGFFTRFWIYEIDRKVIVFPHPLASLLNPSPEDLPAAGNGLNRNRGISGELERIHPYTGSEPLRMIHWKHSARSQDLIVKGFGSAVATPFIIDLDSLPGEGIEKRLSHAAWLVRRWVKERPVGLKIEGRELKPRMGKQHGIALLKELARYGID